MARKVDWFAVWLLVRRADPAWLAIGAASTLVLIGGLTLRWRIFLAQQGMYSSFTKVFSLTWAGQFFNSILPGSTGGDVVKIYQLCRITPDRKATAAATVFADRLSALVALAMMAAAAFLIDPLPLRILGESQLGIGMMLSIILGVAVAGALSTWALYRRLRQTRLVGRIIRTLSAAKKSVTLSAATAAALLLAVALHCLNFFTFYSFARALDVTITYAQVLLMMPVLFFLMLLPITINGHGLREILLIGYFTHLGVTARGQPDAAVQDIAVGVSLLGVANELVWSIPGGLLYLAQQSRSNTRLRRDSKCQPATSSPSST